MHINFGWHGLSGFGDFAPFRFFACPVCVGLCIVLYSIMQHVAIPCIHCL